MSCSDNDSIEQHDQIKDAQYYKFLSDQGDIDATFKYVMILRNGKTIEANKPKAARLLKKCADEGHVKEIKHVLL